MCAERSWFWGGTTQGDAALPVPYGAPYSDDMFSDVYSYILTVDRATQGVFHSKRAGFTGDLDCTYDNNAATVATGIGICDGKVYTNDAAVTLNFPGDGTYYAVLRKSWSAQTIRLVLVTSVTQTDGSTWDVPLHKFVRSGSVVISHDDQRNFVSSPPRKIITPLTDISTVAFLDSVGPSATCEFYIPYDYQSGLRIECSVSAGGTTGDVQFSVSPSVYDITVNSEVDATANLNGLTTIFTCSQTGKYSSYNYWQIIDADTQISADLRNYRGQLLKVLIERDSLSAFDTYLDSVLLVHPKVSYIGA